MYSSVKFKLYITFHLNIYINASSLTWATPPIYATSTYARAAIEESFINPCKEWPWVVACTYFSHTFVSFFVLVSKWFMKQFHRRDWLNFFPVNYYFTCSPAYSRRDYFIKLKKCNQIKTFLLETLERTQTDMVVWRVIGTISFKIQWYQLHAEQG